MKVKLKKKKGLTLIELIVALAISGIVMAMLSSIIVTCYRSYTKENTKAEIQNSAQMVMNKLGDAIMEAKIIEIDGATLKTSEEKDDAFEDKVGKLISYDASAKKLYMTSKPSLGSDKESYLLCSYINNYTITIDDSCKDTADMTGLTLKNPIKLNVSITIEMRNQKITVEQAFVVRDKMQKVVVDGTTYNVK